MKSRSEYLLFATQVIEGYEKACKKALEILPDLVCCSAKNLRNVEEVASLLYTSVMSKQYGNEQFLAKLIAQACGKWGWNRYGHTAETLSRFGYGPYIFM